MGNNMSIQEKIYKCAKGNDAVQLQDIIRQLVSAAADVRNHIEYQDPGGYTPLLIACNRNNYACVEILLRHGANLHHFTRLPEGTTALHEAVARSNLRTAELLLQYGANPFMENARGLTCVDVAINRGHVAMVRSLELRSDYTGTLQMKVSKYMGLGAEWKQRWVVVMPRYQLPSTQGSSQQRVARSLLVCYRSREQCEPVCKVWLDGAVARSVTGSLGSGFLQCALSLHRNHAAASGALMTGDSSSGYTLHLRPPDGSPTSSAALRSFMEIVNGSQAAAPGQQQQQQPTSPPRAGSSRQSSRSDFTSTPTHHQTISDEDLARQLQQQYDAEAGGNPRAKQPPSPIRARPTSQLAGYPQVGAASSTSSPVASSHQLDSRPSAPLYPTIDPSTYGAPPPRPQASQQTHSGSTEPWLWNTSNGQASTGGQGTANGYPQASATTPSPAAPSSSAALRVDDDEAGNCVICMNAPATAGFLHGESVHKCCCKDCAKDFKEAKTPTCPMCRMPIEHVILNFY